MEEEWYDLPDGSQVSIPNNASREDLTSLFRQLSEEFPDTIGVAWDSYGDKEEEEGNLFGALYQAVENIPRGIASVPLLATQGIAGVLTPHTDTALEKSLRKGRDWLYSGIDPKYRESNIANIGMGLGQLVPIIAAARLLGPSSAAMLGPAALRKFAGPALRRLTPAAERGILASAQQITAGSMVSVPMMMGDAATRLSDYEERTGQDVSALKELAAFGAAVPVGVLETLPIVGFGKLPGFASKAAKSKAALAGVGLAEASTAAAFTMGATTEAVQEATSELLQTSVARALYDDEAYERLGERVFDAGIVGGGAGGIAAVLMNLYNRDKGARALGNNHQSADAIERDQARRGGRQQPASDSELEVRQEVTPRGFGLANPELTQEEYNDEYNKRYETHLEQLKAQEAVLAKDLDDEVPSRTALNPDGKPEFQIDVDFKTRTLEDNTVVPDVTEGETITVFDTQGNKVTVQVTAVSPIGGVRVLTPEGQDVLLDPDNNLVLDDVNNPQYVIKDVSFRGKKLSEFTKDELQNDVLPKLEQQLAEISMSRIALNKKGRTQEIRQDINAVNRSLGRTDEVGYQARTPEELQEEARIRVEEDRNRDIESFNEFQLSRNEVELETGLPFTDLDSVGDVSIEELAKLAQEGRITPDEFEKIIQADRISKTGGLDRNEFQEFVERTVPRNNTYDARAVASAILVADPVFTKGAKNSEDVFGEGTVEQQMDKALELLLPLLSPETATLLQTQQRLSPEQVNEVIAEARSATNKGRKGNLFRLKDAYNTLFGFRGGVDLYDRVQRTYKDKGVEWTENRQGEIDFKFVDEREAEVVKLIRGQTAEQIWNNKTGFQKAVEKLLKKKNITLPTSSVLGSGKGLNSEAFTSIVRRVTGKSSLKDLAQPGQRKALLGHLANLPTFTSPTELLDLSPRIYNSGDTQAIVTALNAKPGQDINELGVATISEQGIQDGLALEQGLRHLIQGGYVNKKNNKFFLEPNNRAHARTPQDEMRDEYRRELEEKTKAEEIRNQTLQKKINQVSSTLGNIMVASGLSPAGVELQLSADMDPVYEGLVNEDTGIIKNPEFMERSFAALDGPNAKIFVNLSVMDPDGTRPIQEIIQDFRKEIWRAYEDYQYFFEPEIRAVDGRTKEDVVPQQIWEQYSADPYVEINFLEFADQLSPEGTKGDVMADARAMYMEALSKGLISPKKSAGQIGSLQKRLGRFLEGAILGSRETGLQDVLSIYGQFVSGEIGRRGPGVSVLNPEGPLRNLVIKDYVDPKHFAALEQAIANDDTEAQQKILDQIANEERADQNLADVPDRSPIETLTNRLMAQQEHESTKPGTVPSLGINASDNAIEAYFAVKRGDKPYKMPAPIKHKYRRKVKWTPTKELNDLVEQYGDESSKPLNDERLTGEVLIELRMGELREEVFGETAEGQPITWDDLTPKQQFQKTREVYNDYAISWSEPFKALFDKNKRTALRQHLRRRIADAAYPVELQEQMLGRATDGLRRLADQSAVGAVRQRDNGMSVEYNMSMVGGVQWVGDILNGYHDFVAYGDEQMTLMQMYGLLETAHDRKFATHYVAARRKIDQDRKQQQAEIAYEQAVAKVVAEGRQAGLTEKQIKKQVARDDNVRFFKRNKKSRIYYDKELSPEQQLAKAKEMVNQIEEQAPHVVEFFEEFQKHNLRTVLPWLSSTQSITPEMYEYLEDMAYAPLYKNIGMIAAYPMGSDGTGSRSKVKKKLEFGQMKEADGYLFDHALDSFADLDRVDIIESVAYSQLAMIRDGLSNIAARRVVDTALQLEELGLGKQAYRTNEAGPDTLRVMVDGKQQFWRMADPEMANATMLLGFSPAQGFVASMFEAGKISAGMLRFGIVNFPVFIHRNFIKDGDSLYITMGGQKVSLLPVLRQIEKATESGLLARARMNGLVSGGGGAFFNVSDLISGTGTLEATMNKLGIGGGPGARRARESRQQERYDKVLQSLERGKIEFDSVADYAAFMSVAYRNLRELGEVTARMSAMDLTLGRTGNLAQARLDGVEVMNYGRRGADPALNAIMAMVPFMSGGITGLDNFYRSHIGAPDSLGAHLVDPNMTDEAASKIRTQTWIRGMHLMGALLIYYMMMRDEEAYKRAGEVEKMNNFIIPVGDKYFKMPISFTTGMFYKAIPESILRSMDEEDYGWEEVGAEVKDQIGRNLDFHIMPQALRPIYGAIRNHNDFTNEAIVPSFMEDLPPELQRTEYTSNVATGLAKVFGVIPGPNPLSSPQKMEYLIRQYTGYAGLYSMMVGDRIIREATGQNIVGTRYDWGPSSLLNGQGIENFPVLGDVIGDWREGNASTEKFYELKDEMDIYVRVVNKLQSENRVEDLRKFQEDNAGLRKYRTKVRAYESYMKRWRERRDMVLMSDRFTDEQKRKILYDMIEEKDRALDGVITQPGERPLLGVSQVRAALAEVG
tara:strand:+ start:2275 stop:9573 length:7299 start_codon:yes stop_codon:yes gene_type:complete